MSNGNLIVVDRPSVAARLGRSLAHAGFEVTETSDGSDALRRIAGVQFDAIFCDISAPRVGGMNFLRRLRARSPELPVILIFEAPDNRTAIQATELGVIQSLVKPISDESLAETAAYAIRLQRSRSRISPVGRDYPRERSAAASVSATEAKNEFGRVLEQAIRGEAVVITKHDAPKAVLISFDEFNALSHGKRVQLDALSDEFDALLSRMQSPAARAGMKAAFHASPEQLGRAAVKAARSRG